MQQNKQRQPIDLVLVGGGHSHVQVLEGFAMERPANTRITLIVDQPVATYSGMVPGFVAGQYRQEELEIDVLPLARRIGARVVIARATKIDAAGNRVHLEGRPPIHFDFASINIGSTVAGLSTPGVREYALPTRPIGEFVTKLDGVFERLDPKDDSKTHRVVVVGGGVGGVEVAFALEHRVRELGAEVDVTLVESGPKILPAYSNGMRRRALRAARGHGIRILTGQRIERVESGQAFLEREEHGLSFDLLLWVTGASGSSLFRDSALPTDERSFARVRSTLQLEGYDHVFAVGDCSTLSRHPQTPKAGVYAVRQGPVLTSNLRSLLAGENRLETYTPQHDFLTLINTGNGSAIGGKWSLSFEGHWVFALKDHIDRKFMHRFQPLDDTGRPTAFDSGAMAAGDGDSAMEASCGGCAAKLGRHGLELALSRLDPPPADSSVELGLASADDAACYTSPLGQRIVSSVDQFRAFTDDPYLVGRVGAINAASDLYAKGVEPRFAQALVALPEAEGESQRQETLFQLMAGAARAFEELGVTLVGGHTTTSAELLAGFHIEGFADVGQELLAHAALAENQVLILTKPLGTGVLFRADMMGRARGAWFEQAIASMLRANREASRLARRYGALAATDITGFGLAGHLDAMLQAAGLGAVVDVSALPALPGCLELMAAGLRSTFHDENTKTLDVMAVDSDAQLHPNLDLLFDPQTSGGLLFGVEPQRSESALSELLASGHAAAIIGFTRPGGPGARIRVSTSLT